MTIQFTHRFVQPVLVTGATTGERSEYDQWLDNVDICLLYTSDAADD